MSGIWSLRILDAFNSMDPPVPPSTIHGEGQSPESIETFPAAVLSRHHRANDRREGVEVTLLTAQKGLRLEEGNDPLHEILAVPHDQDERPVAAASVILPDPSAAEPPHHRVEHLPALRVLGVLADVKFRDELPSEASAWIPLDRNMERSFSVDVAGYVGVEPFLLIDRTRHIVTAHVTTLAVGPDKVSSAGFSVVPAYSQIYRQRGQTTVSRRSKPSSRTALTGEQPDPWEMLHPQDATSRHRGAEPRRRCGRLGETSLLSPGYLLAV